MGDKQQNLMAAKSALCQRFDLIAQSNIYSSPAVDHKDQPPFYNQALEFKIPDTTPDAVMRTLLEIEQAMGRQRIVKKGPRTIDLDIIFWGLVRVENENLVIPHPRWNQRAFVVLPLRELPFFQTLQKSYKISVEFDHQAVIVQSGNTQALAKKH